MDLDFDFNYLYHKRSEAQNVPKKRGKKHKKMEQKKRKRKKKKAAKKWDDSRTNLGSHKLSTSKQLEKKLNAVSKHRHYAKDLIQEQKRKHLEQHRLKQEEKEIEFEQKQLIRRKQMLLRKHSVPNLRRAFPQFTAGGGDYDDDSSSDDDDSEHIFQTDESDIDDCENENKAEMTLHALSHKLSSLENELENMKLTNTNMNDDENRNNTENIHSVNAAVNDTNDVENLKDMRDITLDINSINQTLNAAQVKKAIKTVRLKMPTMPSLASVTQPPQLNEDHTSDNKTEHKPKEEEKSINTALCSLDVPSLLMLLDKLKIYFKEIQNEKKQNEEFRSTLLESVNAQNTQILHLLAQSASQQKEMDNLKNTVASLTAKLEEFEYSDTNKNSEPKWTKCIVNENMSNNIALKDIKNVIEESRPNKYKTQNMLNNTDWKSISNVLIPKNDMIEYNATFQQPYTIQKHQRSFLPTHSVQSQSMKLLQEQTERIVPPPQPIPKPSKSKKQNFVGIQQNILDNNVNRYPKVRVERFRK